MTLHHYKVDAFNVAIGRKLAELEDLFSVLKRQRFFIPLCFLHPRLGTFNLANICTFVEKYYRANCSNQQRAQLEYDLAYKHLELKELWTLAGLTSGLFKTSKYSSYPMVNRMLSRLALTLPISIATTNGRWVFAKLSGNLYWERIGCINQYRRNY